MTRSVSASKGALIVVGTRWIDRVVGLISTVILARLLLPEDFGIIAMASIVIGLVDVLLDMGVNVTLIHNKSATQQDYDAAWTLRLIQSALATLLVIAAAGPAATYFHDPRVASVIQVLSLALLLSGFENIGTVTFQKKFEFGVEFRFYFIRRMSGFALTVVCAWLMHSYWALVIGTLGGRAVGVVLSYAMHPMRPRPSFSRMKPMLSFSSWNLLRGIAGYLNDSLHRFVVGGREPTAVMGSYSFGSDIAAIPSTELLAPLNRVLFPMFVAMRDDAARLKRTLLLALGVQTLVAVPAGAGLVLVAREMVLALLGEKWILAVPFVQIIAAVNIVSAIGNSSGFMLLALGRARLVGLSAWTGVLLFTVLSMAVFPHAGAVAIATLRLTVAAFGLMIFLYLVKREMPSLRWGDTLASIWRPCVASAAMALVLLALPSLSGWPPVAQLLIKVSLGATVYLVALGALWRLAGCPEGAESYLLEKARLDRAVRYVLRAGPKQ
jgi:O-antigen/teichoic acid export membrane protein